MGIAARRVVVCEGTERGGHDQPSCLAATRGSGRLDQGVAAVSKAAGENPNWLVLLERLSPAFAPAGEAVRARLASR